VLRIRARRRPDPVGAEIAAVDARLREIDSALAQSSGYIWLRTADQESRELRIEREQLRLLRRQLIAEQSSTRTGDRFVDDRARELAIMERSRAEQAARAGEYARARMHRVDALRSRHVAEHEARLRPFLVGYSVPWPV
jgi:hypothetical protein